MKKPYISLLILSIILCIITIFPRAGYTYSEEMNKKSKFITKYKGITEYKLPNGLKILLKENHSIPLVTFSIWYKVGSRNETDGIRGIAHFLEHMMFKGTNKYKKGEISETIKKYGGVFNAFTFYDGTAYYETVNPKYLEKMVELEANRMKNSLIDSKELTSERTVVLSELKGGLNNPSTVLDQAVRKKAYDSSPYKHPIIGYEEDINKTTSSIMKKFYKKYYSPHNSTIVLVGDFEEEKALALLEKHFAGIKNEGKIEEKIKKEVLQTKEKRLTIKKPGTTKLVEVAFHISSIKDNDIYPLNVLEEILISGNKSRLNEALVEEGLATEVYGGAEGYTDPALFYIIASPTPKTKHEKVEKVILREIEKLKKKPPTQKEVKGAINRIKANYLYNLDGSYNQAVNIGYFEVINSWKSSLDWSDNIGDVKTSEITSVLKKYFNKKNSTIGYFIPELKDGQSYEAAPINVGGPQHYKSKNGKIPTSGKLQKVDPFKYETRKLKDGSKLLIYKNIDLPITYINGIIKGGSSQLPVKDDWVCEFIERTVSKGSKKYSRDNYEDFLDSSGSEIDFSCDEESFKFSAVTLNENLGETVDHLTDALLNPTFPNGEVKKEKDLATAEIIESKDDTSTISRKALSQLIYKKTHPFYLFDFDEDIENIKKVKVGDLKDSHKKLIRNNKATIILVTNLEEKELNKVVKQIEKNLTIKEKKKELKLSIPKTKLREFPERRVNYVKGKTQSDALVAHITDITRGHPDFYKMVLANYIIGGDPLTSRLAKKIRDENGLVYTVISYMSPTHAQGEFGIYFGATNDKVDKTITLLKDEFNKIIKYGLSEKELKKAKKSLIDSFISRNLSTKRKVANTLTSIEFYGLGENYIKDYPEIINSITLKDVNQAIKKHIKPEKFNISVAGDYNPKKVDTKSLKIQELKTKKKKKVLNKK